MVNREPMQDSDITRAIKNCFLTQRVCLETLHHCLTQKSTHFQGRHLAVLQMCADSCELAAKMMLADIQFHRQSCVLAFELCEACAELCERYVDDTAMHRCADFCRTCAASCQGLMGTAVRVPASVSAEGARMPQ